MRKPILRMLTSIDGFIADPGGDLRFGSHWSEEIQRFYVDTFDARAASSTVEPSTRSTCCTGKRLPRPESAPAAEQRPTPKSGTQPRELPKFIASNTRKGITGNTTVLRGAELVEQVATLKGRWRRSAPHVRPSFARDPLSRGARGRVQPAWSAAVSRERGRFERWALRRCRCGLDAHRGIAHESAGARVCR
jgi:hypothetical protein